MKVISFCLWGNNPKYTVGAIRNAELAREIYPQWELWYYYASDQETNVSRAIKAANPLTRIFFTEERNAGWHMMLDRLAPSIEPSVECFISRDCDSRLSQREAEAVNEWLESDKTYHMMADHVYHSAPVMGGMFGVKKEGFNNLYQLAQEWQKNTKAEWQQDQNFLKEVLWLRARRDYIKHDDGFFTQWWNAKPFPNPRSGLGFVGEIYDENDKPNEEHRQILANYLNKHQ